MFLLSSSFGFHSTILALANNALSSVVSASTGLCIFLCVFFVKKNTITEPKAPSIIGLLKTNGYRISTTMRTQLKILLLDFLIQAPIACSPSSKLVSPPVGPKLQQKPINKNRGFHTNAGQSLHPTFIDFQRMKLCSCRIWLLLRFSVYFLSILPRFRG